MTPDQPQPPRRSRLVLRIGLQAMLVVLFLVAALLGTLGGVLFAYASDLPEITALDNYQPNTITRVHARDGQVIGEFATERRIVVGYDDMAPALRQAIIASEDADFEQHFGLSVSRIIITAVKDIITGQRFGASTITQQVARMIFLQEYMKDGVFQRTGIVGLERKIKEAIIALQLEKRYTKREIFTFYANQVPLHYAHGVEAAARVYFDKSAADLSLEEAASLVATIPGPARLNPFDHPTRNLTQRNTYVLPRMAEVGFITAEAAAEAAARPLVTSGHPTPERSIAPYFVEEVRKALEDRYGADALYQAGLRVQSTLDPALQEAANLALDRGLRRLDKRRSGYRKPARNVLAEGHQIATFTSDRWSRAILEGDIVPAVVTAVGAAGARVRLDGFEVDLPPAAFSWTRRTASSALFAEGDLIDVEVREMEGDRPVELALEQAPLVEGALVALDNRTGQIRAMVGGFNFARSKFNRATQARRQIGSLFKPIVYTAAIDRGFTPVSVFIDEPIALAAGPNQPPYSPLNYDREFEGPVTLRRALEQSRNIPAVKAMQELGPRQVVSYAARFGLGDVPPYLSSALGAGEATLVDITSAYSAFVNRGVRMTPYGIVTITDREGNVLEEHRPEAHEAIRADTAFVMTNLLRGVVQRGTAGAAAQLDWPMGGKTGTMDEYTDAWFVGFDPNITVGVWVGYDEKKPLGTGETGASAALPIWIDFMRVYIETYGDRDNVPQFEAPGNIVYVTLDSGVTEAFINGTQPQAAAPAEPAVPLPAAAPPAVPAPAPPAAD